MALIVPIGAQNVFVVGQGLAAGWPRAAWAVVSAASCDTLLIVAGAAGVSGLLVHLPVLRGLLLGVGVLFLAYLGAQSWRGGGGSLNLEMGEDLRPANVVRRTVAVSLLNPHAILDTVGVIGAAITVQPSGSRLMFASGTVTASWLWFLLLAVAASAARRYLTPRCALWFQRASGTILLAFSALLLHELVQFILVRHVV
jgi:L-lysine exporter family protein LysE/ArgO